VNIATGDCRGGDDIPLILPKGVIPEAGTQLLCTEGRLRRAGTHRGEARWRWLEGSRGPLGKRHQLKRGEPQGRKRVAIHAPRRGGESRRGGAEPRGRNTDGAGSSIPKEAGTSGDRREGFREWTPRRARRRRGDLWTIPREEARTTGQEAMQHGGPCWVDPAHKPEFEPQDRVASGEPARRSRGSSAHPQTGCTLPGRWSSKARMVAIAAIRMPGRAAAKAKRAASSSCASPRTQEHQGRRVRASDPIAMV